jgi:hypothetical protein
VTPQSFADVLKAELAYIRRRRYGHDAAKHKPVSKSLVGIALSGGGIRSATTNLGILQALSRMGVLPLVDYMCTVSGGGYIGSCLSSLLSLSTRTASGNGAGLQIPEVLKKGDQPLFTTRWKDFPFNWETARGAAQLRHLRTHGTFLVTRTGILARETMRSVGQLLSGTLYNLSLVLLTLTTVALTYMLVLLWTVNGADDALRAITAPVPVYATAYERQIESQIRPAPAAIPSDQEIAGAKYIETTAFAFPGLWDRFTAKLWKVKESFETAIQEKDRDRKHLEKTAGVGALIATLAFFYLGRFRSIAKRLTPIQTTPNARRRVVSSLQAAVAYLRYGPTPGPGESQEEAFAARKLRIAGFSSLLALCAWLLWAGAGVLRSSDTLTPLLLLLLPLVAVAALSVTTWVWHLVLPRLRWTRDLRSLWGAYEAMAIYALLVALLVVFLPVAIYAFREHQAWVGVSGVAALIIGRALTFRTDGMKRGGLPRSLVRALLGVAIGLGVLLVLIAICAQFVPDNPFPDGPERSVAVAEAAARLAMGAAAAAGILVLLGFVGNANKLSLHYFYRDRLGEAYLYTDQRPAGPAGVRTHLETMRDNIELALSDLHYADPPDGDAAAPTAPYHLISCAINLAASRDLTRKDRKSGYFLYSKFFSGSKHTGYMPTNVYRRGETKLSRAVTISGAAASSGAGANTHFAQSFATVLFNLRLGFWTANPASKSQFRKSRWLFWPRWLWREMMMRTDERSSLVLLSDGGHTGDNVGIYPLLQRQCKLIIACDAECDPSIGFGSFTEALRHASIDLGIEVDIDLTMVRPDNETGMSRSHCAVGLVRYPTRYFTEPDGTKRSERPVGYLVYLKNSLTGDEPEPILNYKSEHPAFPHESTADQFFDDAQFESYRALGYHIAERAFKGWSNLPQFQAWLKDCTARRAWDVV